MIDEAFELNTQKLSTDFDLLWQRLGLKGSAQDCFQSLLEAYQEPQRHYHNLTHIGECLHWFDQVGQDALQPDELAWAIWFHDAIYDPQAKDNEQRSAQWSHDVLTQHGADSCSIERVDRLITATAGHLASDDIDPLMMDIDLSILGAEPTRFDEYDTQIREEYRWVPESEYRVARVDVLADFLTRESIYATAAMNAELESHARANLAIAVNRLKVPKRYQPIRCDLYDYLEIACLRRLTLEIELKEGSVLAGSAIDTETKADEGEFFLVKIQDRAYRVRLDTISSLTPLDSDVFGRIQL